MPETSPEPTYTLPQAIVKLAAGILDDHLARAGLTFEDLAVIARPAGDGWRFTVERKGTEPAPTPRPTQAAVLPAVKATTAHDARFYCLKDIAAMLQVSLRTAQDMASKRTIPGRVALSGATVRFSRGAVDCWLVDLAEGRGTKPIGRARQRKNPTA